jgi:hypothetical protein
MSRVAHKLPNRGDLEPFCDDFICFEPIPVPAAPVEVCAGWPQSSHSLRLSCLGNRRITPVDHASLNGTRTLAGDPKVYTLTYSLKQILQLAVAWYRGSVVILHLGKCLEPMIFSRDHGEPGLTSMPPVDSSIIYGVTKGSLRVRELIPRLVMIHKPRNLIC